MGLNINVRIVSSLLMSERSARRAGLDHGKRTKPARLRLLDSVLPRYSESCLASDLIQIRAFAAGRQPMLLDIIELRSPAIDPAMDDILWRAPRPLDGVGGSLLSGAKSHCSTAFHWTARLIVLCRTIMDNLYSPWSRATRSEQTLQEVSHQLDNWFSQFPLSPAHRFPLPHILLLHMIYQLMVIFVHRPFYRSSSVSSAGKCDQASLSILQLLQLFDTTHSIRMCHHNLSKYTSGRADIVNVIFGAATVFLLRCVGSPREDPSHALDLQHFNECVSGTVRCREDSSD